MSLACRNDKDSEEIFVRVNVKRGKLSGDMWWFFEGSPKILSFSNDKSSLGHIISLPLM